MSMSEQITVVIPTSPIPSHPSTAIIDRAIASVRAQLPNSTLIVSIDGVEGEIPESYEIFKRLSARVFGKSLLFERHLHQSGMLPLSLECMDTPLLLYLEHDWELLPDIPWAELSQLILSGEYNYIKLHAAPRISPWHEHLMAERVMHKIGEVFVPIIKTIQWSQNPHLASTQFYREKILPHCEGKTDFIENIMHGIVASAPFAPWEEFKCGIYNPPSGDMMKCHHLDGKNSK
jgi:hypothetical protein